MLNFTFPFVSWYTYQMLLPNSRWLRIGLKTFKYGLTNFDEFFRIVSGYRLVSSNLWFVVTSARLRNRNLLFQRVLPHNSRKSLTLSGPFLDVERLFGLAFTRNLWTLLRLFCLRIIIQNMLCNASKLNDPQEVWPSLKKHFDIIFETKTRNNRNWYKVHWEIF